MVGNAVDYRNQPSAVKVVDEKISMLFQIVPEFRKISRQVNFSADQHEIAKILIEAGADLSFVSETYGSLLEVASDDNDEKMVALLLKHGAR